MEGPQITMIILIIWIVVVSLITMLKKAKSNVDRVCSYLVPLMRAAGLIGVLWWGGFWG